LIYIIDFFFSSRRRHTRFSRDWSSDVCSSDLVTIEGLYLQGCGFLGDSLTELSADAPSLVQTPPCTLAWVKQPKEMKNILSVPRSEERRVGKECRCRR